MKKLLTWYDETGYLIIGCAVIILFVAGSIFEYAWL